MSSTPLPTAPRLLSLLPAIYREDAFLGPYLAAFEQVLLELEHKIDTIATLFDPATTPKDFLQWLSSWMAFTLRADIGEEQRRRFLARVIPLYRLRGTKQSLEQLLGIFTHGQPIVSETTPQLQIGVTSTVGVNTFLGAGAEHHFQVKVLLPNVDQTTRSRDGSIARALIELDKPAHTSYELIIESPALQIGTTSHVGVDTLLGTIPAT
jgi:phage tail-like protein